MAKLQDKIKLALDEARMLVLGSQILLGFQYRVALEPGFEKLPTHAQYTKLLGLASILVANLLLMWPTTYHQISEHGEDSPDTHQFTTRVVCWALGPFAAALGLDFYVALTRMGSAIAAMIGASVTTFLALFFWFGLEQWQRARDRRDKPEPRMKKPNEQPEGKTKLFDKINQLLTESRVVIPGAQALLGFQLAAMFMDGFDKLSRWSQYVHVASLALIGIATILLMTPAAYHRIVEDGEDTERFYDFARRVVLWSMVPLAAGMAGDFYVVVVKVTGSTAWGATVAGIGLIACYAAWFGYSWWCRSAVIPSTGGGEPESKNLAAKGDVTFHARSV